MTRTMLRCDYHWIRTALIYHDVSHTVNPRHRTANSIGVDVCVDDRDATKFGNICKRFKIS